ncbi:MAG: 4a-hydroxytetrahydrobiopterin dehydratase [Bacteriovoracaceae bacterium]
MELKEILATKEELHGDWELTHNSTRLLRKYKFKNFKEPFALLIKVSELAEIAKHHPELKLGWGYLEIEIYTHTVNGLQLGDFNLARKIDALV